MKLIFSLITVFILSIQYESTSAIISGTNAGKREFVWEVSFQKISKKNKHYCGGSIVSEKFVLSAAHCVIDQDIHDIRLIVGIKDLRNKLKEKNIRYIERVFIHPDINKPLPKANDLVMVKVKTAFKFGKSINKIQLPAANFALKTGQVVHIAGWGVEKTGSTTPSDKLKKTKVHVIDHHQCVEMYKGKLIVTDKIFCTNHNEKHNKGVCNGDSGAAVILDKKILVGVIEGSYVMADCGDKKFPDMQTEVAKYRTWIDSTIANNH